MDTRVISCCYEEQVSVNQIISMISIDKSFVPFYFDINKVNADVWCLGFPRIFLFKEVKDLETLKIPDLTTAQFIGQLRFLLSEESPLSDFEKKELGSRTYPIYTLRNKYSELWDELVKSVRTI